MKNNLLSSALIVFAFWYAVLLLVGWYPPAIMLAAVLGTLMIWAAAWPMGAIAAFVTNRVRLGLARTHVLDGALSDEDLKATVMADPKALAFVQVPLPAMARVARGKGAQKLLAAYPWCAGYHKKFPVYAQALLAVTEVMQSKPGLPAAPEPKGHGGATLWAHSGNVLRAMQELAPSWRYTGMRNSKGVVVVPVQDLQKGYHAFAQDDPLLILAAIAHDLGKVDCYEWDQKSGRVKEVKDNHGTVGASMLRRMPEILALPLPERDALLLAVSYYHHPSDMPTSLWIGDMARSLTLLLYEADCLASVREGDPNPEKQAAVKRMQGGQGQGGFGEPSQDDDAAEEADAPEASVPESEEALDAAAGVGAVDEGSEEGAERDADDLDLPTDPEKPAPAPVAVKPAGPAVQDSGESRESHWASEDGRTPLDVLEELLRLPDAINGKNEDRRIAFKHGEWIYIFEAKMRRAAAALIGDPSLEVLRGSTNLHKFTLEMLRQIDARGGLFAEFEGRAYSYKRGLWNCKVGTIERQMLIVKADLIGQTLGDAKYAPMIIRNFWGETAALNKKNAATREKLNNQNVISLLQMAREGVLPSVQQGSDEHPVYFIDIEDVRKHFDVDEKQLPENVEKVRGANSSKNYLSIDV